MSTIPISEIVIPEERIRRDFDEAALLELKDSILQYGLIHPICLRDDAKTLVAGERRTKAHWLILEMDEEDYPETISAYAEAFIVTGEIPYTTMGELTEAQRIEVELEENVRRRDLSWQDQARAHAQLHALRVAQHGEAKPGSTDGWSIKDTAEEIAGHAPSGGDRTEVSDELFLNDFLDDPLVANAPTKKDALKVIGEMALARKRKEKADNWDPATAEHTCIHGSCYDLLVDEELDVPLFDCIISDPPYGRAMHKQSFSSKHNYDDSREVFLEFLEKFPAIAREITKPQAHAYMFHDVRDFEKSMIAWEIGGWKVWPWPLIWDKGNIGSYGAADQGPRHVYDAILYANKGERPCIMMQRDVININQETSLPHPAGKPIELYAELLKRSCEPGDYVLDPMCGGGTIFPAASRLKLHATGIELDEKYYHMAIEMAQEGK